MTLSTSEYIYTKNTVSLCPAVTIMLSPVTRRVIVQFSVCQFISFLDHCAYQATTIFQTEHNQHIQNNQKPFHVREMVPEVPGRLKEASQ